MKMIFSLLILLASTLVFAAAPQWEMIPAQSTLKFTATQNNAPVSGEFKHFTTSIYFDPDHLDQNSVKVVVDMNSLTDSYAQLHDTLDSSEWFNIKMFPNAVFHATKFSKTGDKTYQATGTLTIRDKTQPVTLNFNEIQNSGTQAKISGYTIVKRSAFGVGQGEWAGTDEVRDDVKVEFVISAVKK